MKVCIVEISPTADTFPGQVGYIKALDHNQENIYGITLPHRYSELIYYKPSEINPVEYIDEGQIDDYFGNLPNPEQLGNEVTAPEPEQPVNSDPEAEPEILGWAIIRKMRQNGERSPYYGWKCFWTEEPRYYQKRPDELLYTVHLVPSGILGPNDTGVRRYYENDLEFIQEDEEADDQANAEETMETEPAVDHSSESQKASFSTTAYFENDCLKIVLELPMDEIVKAINITQLRRLNADHQQLP